VTAYSSLGGGESPSLLENEVIQGVAKKINKTPGQVLTAWALQRVTSVIPKTSHVERLKENLEGGDFELERDDFETICRMTTKHRFLETKSLAGFDIFKEAGEKGFIEL